MSHIFDTLFLEETKVQAILDNYTEGQTLIVTFAKKDNSVVTYSGTMEKDANRSHSVAIYTEEGWKRFNIDRVFMISFI